jgi:hypothetical protein
MIINYDNTNSNKKPFDSKLTSLSPAMQEYHNTRRFSPALERKKFCNIEKFFMVSAF